MDGRYLERLSVALRDRGVSVEPGLSGEEITRVEEDFGFVFPEDLRALLAHALPAGADFPDWRDGNVQDLLEWLDAPAEGICFDVEHSGFWFAEWGVRPEDPEEAADVARMQISRAPMLIPLHSNRFLPAEPAREGNPVLLVDQSQVQVAGARLEEFFEKEFGVRSSGEASGAVPEIGLWSALARMK